MSECHVYVCHWRRTSEGFEGWLERWPTRRVTGEDFHDMLVDLADIVGEEVGDGEPQFEFEPPYIEAAAWEHLFREGWRSADVVTALELTHQQGIFTGGFCGACKWPIGQRTDAPLEVKWGPWAKGPTSFAASANSAMRIPVMSEELLRLFTPEERAAFDTRRVHTEPESGQEFFEVIPRQFVPIVPGRALEPGGARCPKCDRRYIWNKALGYGPDVVSRETIPPGDELFFLGCPGRFSFGLSAKRWDALKAPFRRADFSSSPLAIIEPQDREDSLVFRDFEFK